MKEALGKYQLRGTLGRGAMGLVYDGWDPQIHRQVAIKTVRLAGADDEEAAEGLARFRREAQAAGRLSHPNIVGVYDFGETDEVAYIVMEFVAGGSLKEVLDRREPLEAAWVCGIMGQVLAALAFSHARGVVHRDVKPANVMLTADGAVKLADFGIARIESSNATSVGVILGTPAYMAPEQFLGEPADARSDIYAAGAMLFHLLTATRPYEGNPSAIMHKVLNAPVPPAASERLPGLPAALDPVLQRAMARRPEDRFQDAASFSAAMNAALCGPAPDAAEERTMVMRSPARPSPPAEAPVKARPHRGANLPVLGGAAALLLAASAGAWFLTRPSSPPPPPMASPAASVPATPDRTTGVPAPPPDPASAARAVSLAVASVPCTLVSAASTPAGVTVSGIAGAGGPEANLRQAASAQASGTDLAWHVEAFEGPYCTALDAVAQAARSGRIDLALRENAAHLVEDTHLHVRISGLNFPAYLRVDYLSSDGQLSHLYPHEAERGAANAHDPSVQLPQGGSLALGYVPHQVIAVGPPFGTDMLLVVASGEPLLAAPRPNTEAKAPYLATLQRAIADAAAHGGRIAAGALTLQTVAR